MAQVAEIRTDPQWKDVCPLERIPPDSGVAALLDGQQIALFRVDDGVYAIDNHDPFSGANVLARGIVGERSGEFKVASPIYKQSFSLVDGRCMDAPGVSVQTWPARVRRGVVQIATALLCALLLAPLRDAAAAETPASAPPTTPAANAAPALAPRPGQLAAAPDLTPGLEIPGNFGRVHAELRPRLEIADIDGFDTAWAWTLRSRIGYETPAWQGLSGYVEMENVAAIDDDDSYFDAVSTPNGESLVADPTSTELNRAFVKLERSEWASKAVVGRQRLILDDERFVGNVGWRQNEQTFDAALLRTSFGVEGLSLTYAYLWEILRIFGDEGGAATKDFDSNTHLVRLGYERYPFAKPVLFAYLLDFDNSPGNSANSYGLRVTGDVPVAEGWTGSYQTSYAHQTEAGDNPVDYDADYFFIDTKITQASLGALGIGYEILGSDDGEARFVTPLATGHRWNGWADVFLDNGGPNGLRDFYAYVSPKLPWALTGQLIYHNFESDQGGDSLGNEIDALLARAFGPRLKVLAKFAWYDSDRDGAPADRVRGWLQAEVTL